MSYILKIIRITLVPHCNIILCCPSVFVNIKRFKLRSAHTDEGQCSKR